MSADKAITLGVTPMAYWIASVAAGVNPRTLGLGPIPDSQKALQRADLHVSDVDLIGPNETLPFGR